MRLDWVIPCTGVEFRDEGTTIQGAGINCVRVRALPVEIQFTVLLRVVGLTEDFIEEAPRGVEVYLTGPGLDHLAALEFEVPTGEAPDGYEGWEIWTLMPVAIKFTAAQLGHHMLDVYLATDRPKHLVDPGRRRSLPLTILLEDETPQQR